MDFTVSPEQEMVVDTVWTFVERELVGHEAEVERTGQVSPELVEQIPQPGAVGGDIRGQYAG